MPAVFSVRAVKTFLGWTKFFGGIHQNITGKFQTWRQSFELFQLLGVQLSPSAEQAQVLYVKIGRLRDELRQYAVRAGVWKDGPTDCDESHGFVKVSSIQGDVVDSRWTTVASPLGRQKRCVVVMQRKAVVIYKRPVGVNNFGAGCNQSPHAIPKWEIQLRCRPHHIVTS